MAGDDIPYSQVITNLTITTILTLIAMIILGRHVWLVREDEKSGLASKRKSKKAAAAAASKPGGPSSLDELVVKYSTNIAVVMMVYLLSVGIIQRVVVLAGSRIPCHVDIYHAAIVWLIVS